jgi:hypothetical protein
VVSLTARHAAQRFLCALAILAFPTEKAAILRLKFFPEGWKSQKAWGGLPDLLNRNIPAPARIVSLVARAYLSANSFVCLHHRQHPVTGLHHLPLFYQPVYKLVGDCVA